MNEQKRQAIVEALTKAFNMEIETAINYLACSIALDGVRAEEIKKSLAADIPAEMGHATQLANRIKTIGGSMVGTQALKWTQNYMQPPADTTDVVAVIKGVIVAEEEAINHYNHIIQLCDGVDYVTQDLVITILGDEEEHRRTFQGFLKEYIKS